MAQPPYLDIRRLILLDFNMLRIGRIEFLEALRKDLSLPSVPVIVLTTSDDEHAYIETFRFHFSGYILKPAASSTCGIL